MPKKPAGNRFAERMPLPTLMGQPTMLGRLHALEKRPLDRPAPFYENEHGTIYLGDSMDWLASLPAGSVDLIFADPPYSLGKAAWDEFESHDAYVDWSVQWVELAARTLKPHGSLYICGFSEILADIRRPMAQYFHGCRWLVWHYKNKANLSNDWGRSHESILHFRKSKRSTFNVDPVRVPYGTHTTKYPSHPQAVSSQYGNGKKRDGAWEPNPNGAKPRDVIEIPVTSNGMAEKTPHPTQKPEELVRKIILASSNPGECVVDPFLGSGTTAVCAEQLGRRWMGCELDENYCKWAVARVEYIPHRDAIRWVKSDRVTAMRRESIR